MLFKHNFKPTSMNINLIYSYPALRGAKLDKEHCDHHQVQFRFLESSCLLLFNIRDWLGTEPPVPDKSNLFILTPHKLFCKGPRLFWFNWLYRADYLLKLPRPIFDTSVGGLYLVVMQIGKTMAAATTTSSLLFTDFSLLLIYASFLGEWLENKRRSIAC